MSAGDWNIGNKPAIVDWAQSLDAPIRQISKLLSLVIKNERPAPHKKPEFRMSKMPICGLLHTIEELEGKSAKIQYSTDFFTSIGDAIHETLQQHFPLTKDVSQYVFGNWKCNNPKCEKYDKVVKFRCTTPEKLKCPKCSKRSLEYSELKINYKGVTGHIDLILLIDGVFYLLDFKTTSEYNVKNPSRYLPYPKNVIQIESYLVPLQEQFDIKISHYILFYISRNSTESESKWIKSDDFVPIGVEVTDAIYQRRKKHLDAVAKQKNLVEKFLNDPNKKRLRKLSDARPCHSKEQYKDKKTGMSHAFFSKQECIYFEKGSCFSDDKLVKPAKDIWKLVKEKHG
jgi:hypothetical protein